MTTENDLTKSVDIGVAQTPDTPPASAADDQNAAPAKAESEEKPQGQSEEQAQESEKSDDTEQQEQKKSRFQRRLERQKEARIRAETEARMLREQLAALDGRNKQQPQESGAPKREDFESYEDFIKAEAVYVAKLEAKQIVEQAQRQAQQQGERSRAAVEHEKIAAAWNKAEQVFSKTHKDYEQVVSPFVEDELGSFSDPARRAIVESDFGPHVLYHLASNPEEADRIANLSPTQQVKELGKLELKLSIPAKDKTNAPPPPSHERGSRSQNTNLEAMTDKEYFEFRKAQGARWAR